MTDEIIIYNIMIENDCNNKNEISIIKEIEPLRILGLKKSSKYGLLFRVEWKERVDGIKPANSIIENKVMRKKYPLLLLSYYEERMISVRNCKELKKKFYNIEF